jgi:hypothetical protein
MVNCGDLQEEIIYSLPTKQNALGIRDLIEFVIRKIMTDTSYYIERAQMPQMGEVS